MGVPRPTFDDDGNRTNPEPPKTPRESLLRQIRWNEHRLSGCIPGLRDTKRYRARLAQLRAELAALDEVEG